MVRVASMPRHDEVSEVLVLVNDGQPNNGPTRVAVPGGDGNAAVAVNLDSHERQLERRADRLDDGGERPSRSQVG